MTNDATTDFSGIWGTQKSLTEWMEDIHHANTEAIRKEDNDKRERLAVLHNIIGLPFDRPVQFSASELADPSPAFQQYLRDHGDELCALRLIPTKEKLPKLRMRGKTVAGAFKWFGTQQINPRNYRADFLGQEKESRWATIFVVNQRGIHGEIIYGKHFQLTQGFHQTDTPKVFHYDFKSWTMTPANDEALAHVQGLIKHLQVTDAGQRAAIATKLHGTFAHDYLEGYFETVDSVDFGTWFLDYSPSLGKMFADLTADASADNALAHQSPAKVLVHGQSGSNGTASGPVCIVDPENIGQDFPEGGVLVCKVTTPNYVPLMQKAAAIVTNQGGILSHAAIVARELGVPCVVGTGNATTVLKNGQLVTVDAGHGDVFLAS